MTPRLIVMSMLALSSVAMSANANAADLAAAIAGCDSNPGCSRSTMDGDGGMTFVVTLGARTLRVHCNAYSNCMRQLARGRHAQVDDIVGLVSLP